MRDHDVYEDDMSSKRFSDAEVERILTGQTPDNSELALLGSVLTAVHAVEPIEPGQDLTATFASQAASIARAGAGKTPEAKPVRRRSSLVTIQDRLAIVAVAMFVLVGMSGLAVAADASAPGDILYGLDRALERIGINDGAAEERLAEAGALADRGELIAAIVHAASAIERPADEDDESIPSVAEAATALREAADSVEGGDDQLPSEEVQTAVSAMLSEMAQLMGDPDLDGAEFGRRVSEMARSIGDGHDSDDRARPGPPDRTENDRERRPDDAGPPDDAPGGPPEDIPGGPPDDVPGGPAGGSGGSLGGGPPSNTPGQGGPPPGSGRP